MPTTQKSTVSSVMPSNNSKQDTTNGDPQHMEDDAGPTYLFASVPSTPKDKPADMLVKFQAVSRTSPAVDVKSVYISSRCTLLEARRILHKFFCTTYERGFVFLHHGKEVLRHRERAVRLVDVMPRLPLGLPSDFFKFPDVQYKKQCLEKEGRRVKTYFAGVVFLCEKSTSERWQGHQLKKELSADRIPGFSFLPANIMSANEKTIAANVDAICELAALGATEDLFKEFAKVPAETRPEALRDRSLVTPLHYACKNGHMGVAEIIVGRLGREVIYLRDVYGKSPLHNALYSHRLEIVSYLLQLGPDLQAKDSLGYSCSRLITTLPDKDTEILMGKVELSVLESSLVLHFLNFAFQTKNLAVCKNICQFVHPVRSPFYRPPLHQAAELGDAELVQLLLQHRQSPRVVYNSEYCDNISVISYENLQRSTEEIHQNGISSEGKEVKESYQTIETMAKKEKYKVKNFDIISDLDIMLDDIPDTSHRQDTHDSDGHLPFHYACQHGHTDCVDLLYYKSMNNDDFVKGLKLALFWNKFATVQLLVNIRQEFSLHKSILATVVKEIDKDFAKSGKFLLPVLKQSPLLLTRYVPQAAIQNDTNLLALLLNLKVLMGGEDFMMRSPLHEACQQGKEAAVKFLLSHGSDPTRKDWRGSTPLHYACAAGQLEVVKILVTSQGVDLAASDCNLTTPALLAAQHKHQKIILYLVEENLNKIDLLRYNIHGDCVLNYMADFDEGLFKIILEAAIKQKENPTPKLDLTSLRPRFAGIDPELLEAWSDPSVCTLNNNDKRADLTRRKRQRQSFRIKCLICLKKFTSLNTKAKWSHLCVSPLAIPELNPSKRSMVVADVCKFQDQDTSDSDRFERSISKLPYAYMPVIQPPSLTPVDIAIIRKKYDLIPDILNTFPEYRKREKTAFLAARLMDIEALKLLHSAENFSKQTFTNLLHIVLLQQPCGTEEKDRHIKTIGDLLKMGASPNYIPSKDTFAKEKLSPSEQKLLHFMPLEIAAITENLSLVELLLEFEVSVSISFAVHLAVLKGNLAILEKILPLWKEGRWKSYIKGFHDDANELVRVCTLDSGLVQAVCASRKCSMELLTLVKNDEKCVFGCKKILTHHMVNQIRPDICSMTSPTPMNRILYKHAEDLKGGEEICQHLYITNLLMCKEKFLTASVIDTYAAFLVENECYLGEIRVSKKNNIHVVCDAFVMAIKRRMWSTVETLLKMSGNTLWKCLTAPHHSCHKFPYGEWKVLSGHPCLSSGMLKVFYRMPLYLLKIFLDIGEKTMSRHDMKSISAKIGLKEDETPANSKMQTSTPRQGSILKDVLLYHVKSLTPKHTGQLIILCKLTILFPDIFPETLETIRWSSHRFNWFTAAGVDPVLKALLPHCKTDKLIKQIKVERFELRLWTVIMNMPAMDVNTILHRDLNLLHVACLQNDLRLVQACMNTVTPIATNKADKKGVTPMDIAASTGNLKILELLKQKGGTGGPSIVIAACVGKGFLSGLLSTAAAKKTDALGLQNKKVEIIDWLFKNVKQSLNLTHRHPRHGSLFDVILNRQSWTVMEWALENIGLETSAAILSKSPYLDSLAYAPENLLQKICRTYPTVLQKMPLSMLQKFLLKLSAFPGTHITEQMLKKLLALKVVEDQIEILKLLAYRGIHGETVLHNACRCGNAALVKCVVTTIGQYDFGMNEILKIIDSRDKSGCTPVWYSLSYRFWKIAEYLIVNGARDIPKRAIPGLWNKRMFTEMSRRMSIMSQGSNRGLLATAQIKRGNSSRIADIISPGSVIFRDLYLEATPSEVSERPESEHSRLASGRKSPAPPRSARRVRTPRESILIQDDMESVGVLQSPRTPRSSRILLHDRSGEETFGMSPRLTYPDDEENMELAKENIQKKKRVRYLLSLVNFTAVNKGTLLHAACCCGNTLLLKGIVTSPLWKALKSESRTFSPFIYSLANNCPEATSFCIKHNLGPSETDPFDEVLSFVIMRKYGFEPSHKTLKRLLNRFTISKDTIRGIKLSVLPKTVGVKKLLRRGTLLNANTDGFNDDFIMQLIQMAIKHENGNVSNRLLMTMAAIGRVKIVTAILGIIEDKTQLTEIFKRKVVPNATVLDLLFLLAPSRITLDQHEPEYLERMKIMNIMTDFVRLEIADRTLSAATKKNLIPMLEMVVKDHTRNNIPLNPPEFWYEVLFKASTNGDLNFINTICVAEINTKPHVIQAAMLKALCLASLRRQRAVANRLLLFKMPLMLRVGDVPGRYSHTPRLTLECAIEGGDSVIATLILQTMEETGLHPDGEDILSCIFMAFDKGMEAIVDNLLRFAHVASPSLVTLKICHYLFLSSARHGNGMVCVKFISLPEFNVNACDEDGFTALHYACMHGKGGLVKEIMEHSSEAIHTQTPEGWTPLDLARAFGHIDLALELVSSYGASQGRGFDILTTQSWLKRFLIANAESDEGNSLVMSPAGTSSRHMDIVTLLTQGNDVAAKSMLEVAQESVVACVIFMYDEYPLIHLCAKTGCDATLELLMKLISAQPNQDLKKFLEKELKGKIPLCIAIENCNVECVCLLQNAYFPSEWRYAPTGESILHFAAKTNNAEVVQLVTMSVNHDSLQVQDADGLIPATTAIALGNHATIQYFLNGLRFAEKLHHGHTKTTYWCVLCLLDCCIGWSKIFLGGTQVQLNGKGRNIFQRHRTESGFCVHSHNGNNAYSGHILESMHKWLWSGGSNDVLASALGSMQYSTNGFKSKLFLLLSQMTRFEAMSYLIKKGETEVACYLYEKLLPSLDMSSKVLHFINAAAFGREELVKKILDLSGEEMAGINYEGEYSALDVAVAFGHKSLLQTISKAFENSTALNSLKFLDKQDQLLSLDTKWSLKLSRIGDKEWRESVNYDTNRLSHVDMFLLKKGVINCFPADMLPRDMLPTSLRGREIEINYRSIQAAVLELEVSDVYLTSLLVSKAVLGRYYSEVDEKSEAWETVQKLVLHCVTPASAESSSMDLQWKDLHDYVMIQKSQDKDGGPRIEITTAVFPEVLTPFHNLKASITDQIIPDVKKQISTQLYGLDLDITIDWNTIETSHDEDKHKHLLEALVGTTSTGPLAGLSKAVELCSDVMKDIEYLYDEQTAKEMMKIFDTVTEIQVKYLKALPKAKDVITVPNDGRMTWHFMLEEGRPRYNTSLFSVSVLVQMFHTVAVCLHSGIHAFTQKNVFKGRKKLKTSFLSPKEKKKEQKNITLLVNWKSFAFLNRLKSLMQFVENAMAPQMSAIGAQYNAMLRLEIDVHTVHIQNVTNAEEAGISVDEGIMKICFHSYAITHNPWTVAEIDASKVFTELEVAMLSSKWRTGSVNVTGSRHRAVSALLENIGFPVELPFVGQHLLEMLCRLDSRQMVHPYQLLRLFGTSLFKNVAYGYIESVISKLSFCSDSYFIGNCDAPSGLYSWLRQFEAQPQTQLNPNEQFLLYHRADKTTPKEFTLMTKIQIRKIPRNRIAGLWQRIPMTKVHEALRHPRFARSQLIVMNNKVFLTTSSPLTFSFLSSLPETVSVASPSAETNLKCITFDQALTRPLDVYDQKVMQPTPMLSSLGKPFTSENYAFLSWQLGAEKGFNVAFELMEPKGNKISSQNDDKSASEKERLPDNFYITYATYCTLKEVTDYSLYDSQDRKVIASLFSNIGTISIGPVIPKSSLELIEGKEFDEHADVYLVSDRDVHIFPKGQIWSGESPGSPYPQALLVALCNMFLQQTKSHVSTVLSQNLSRSIDPADIKFKERVTSADQLSSLASTQKSVKALKGTINRILSVSTVGARKLKMDLTGVEFRQHERGPMVSFDSGVLKCPLFKKGTNVDQRAMDRAFYFAVDEEGGRTMMQGTEDYSEYDGMPGKIVGPDCDDGFSVTSSKLPTIHHNNSSILEQQRIAKHPSEDSHVIELAVKRLFSGVEIGRTSDIVDSLDLGANINSLNNNQETPLVVAAKSRNYTIIDLLLTRGAAPNMADVLGVTPLHYESGQGDVEAVKLMLSYGADPNAPDLHGRTPLHYAVVGDYEETVDLLVFCGANASMVNKDGESPMTLANFKEIKSLLRETDLIIRGIQSGNVSIEHLTLQAETIYKLTDTGLTIRTPSGMGLAKTSLMVRRVVPEYSYFGPKPTNQELLLSDIYDFRISGAYVEEPLLLQIPAYSRTESYEDIFVKTDKKTYTAPIRVVRIFDANKVPHWICHARLCLHGIRSIALVARPRSEKFKVTPSGLDFKSNLDPLIRVQFRQNAVQEESEVTLQVTSKPSYEEEDYDSILSMSNFFGLSSNNQTEPQNDVLVALPLPENYLGHGVLHVLMQKETRNVPGKLEEPWVELLRNPDYASDVVKLRISHFGQICLLERNPQYPMAKSANSSSEAIKMTTNLFNKTNHREYNACFLAMAKPLQGSRLQTEAEVVVECILSSKIHARLQHWRAEGFIDLKPSHTTEFTAHPSQAFVIKAGGCCAYTGINMPPLQFHPKRNNCVRFTVHHAEDKGSDAGHIEVMLRAIKERPKSASHMSQSYDSVYTINTDASRTAHQDELLSRIPLFLPWTATPDDPRGQDKSEKTNLSPFDTPPSETDTRGLESPVPSQSDHLPVIGKPQENHKHPTSHVKQVQGTQLTAVLDPRVVEHKPKSQSSGLLLKPGKAVRPDNSNAHVSVTVSELPATPGKSPRPVLAGGNSIRAVTPSCGSPSSRHELDMPDSGADTTHSVSHVSTPREERGVLDWLAIELGGDWLRMGVLLGVPYASLQAWMDDKRLTDQQRAMKMLHQWKHTRRTRQDHGVPELLLTLQRLGKTVLVRSLKDKLRAWIAENLEGRGSLKGVVNKNLLEDAENLEPMTPLFLLSLVRKIGFSLDFIYDLGLSRPEVSGVMTDPFLKHKEDKMLGLLLICRDKELSADIALEKIINTLISYGRKNAVEWIVTSCRQWLTNQGCADDHFAHAVGDVIHRHSAYLEAPTEEAIV